MLDCRNSMRRTALVASLLTLPGCTGYVTFLDHVIAIPGGNPNVPVTDSQNLRRVLGHESAAPPLLPEAGNVWPGRQAPDPSLADLQTRDGTGTSRGFVPTTVAGAERGLPDHRQPRPLGSSTPPSLGALDPVPGPAPGIGPIPPPPRSSVPGPGPTGSVVQTPRGPAVDAGGTRSYRQLLTPQGPGAIMVPNGNGTSTILSPNGGIQTIPTPR